MTALLESIHVLLLQYAIYTRLPLTSQGTTDTKPDDDYSKGVVFYMREKKVVGVLTWNCYGKMDLAREVITHQLLMCVCVCTSLQNIYSQMIAGEATKADINKHIKDFDIHTSS